jgi:peptide-methionine (R)-S-oxide reductase
MNDTPKTEEEWKAKLTPEQYAVLREKGTDAPFDGALLHEERTGMFKCAACGQQLFASDTKFDSGSGWPSFDKALPGATKLIEDTSHGMRRTEVVCSNCGSHLGHLFNDQPRLASGEAGGSRTGNRFCINSTSLQFAEQDARDLAAYKEAHKNDAPSTN